MEMTFLSGKTAKCLKHLCPFSNSIITNTINNFEIFHTLISRRAFFIWASICLDPVKQFQEINITCQSKYQVENIPHTTHTPKTGESVMI